jgi:hypothetical protein
MSMGAISSKLRSKLPKYDPANGILARREARSRVRPTARGRRPRISR